MAQIFHLAEPEHWEQAQASGSYEHSTRGRTLKQEGYIHCSTPGQWQEVRRAVYADHPGELVLLTIDSDLLASPVRMETPDADTDELFPHVYGPIGVDAVVATERLHPPHA